MASYSRFIALPSAWTYSACDPKKSFPKNTAYCIFLQHCCSNCRTTQFGIDRLHYETTNRQIHLAGGTNVPGEGELKNTRSVASPFAVAASTYKRVLACAALQWQSSESDSQFGNSSFHATSSTARSHTMCTPLPRINTAHTTHVPMPHAFLCVQVETQPLCTHVSCVPRVKSRPEGPPGRHPCKRSAPCRRR